MDGNNNVMVFCESDASGNVLPASLEALGLGIDLAKQLGSGVFAATQADLKDQLNAYALDTIYCSAPAEHVYPIDWWTSFVEAACKECGATSVIFAHTPLGQDIAARLAPRLSTWFVSDAVGVKVQRGKLVAEKPVQGGVALAEYSFNTVPQIVTVRARVGSVPEESGSGSPEIKELDVPDSGAAWELVERVEEGSSELKVEDAKVVVSGGRGMGGPEGFDMLRDLAGVLEGAVGASRPPCDSGWIPSSHQVGITGKVISPDLYIAVGISGASQHLSGMSDSGKIVAINKDPEAEIFKVSNYGVVGDFKKIFSALVSALKQKEA